MHHRMRKQFQHLIQELRTEPSRHLPPRRIRVLSLEHLEFRTLLTTVAVNSVADNTLYESSTGDVSNGKGIHLFAGVTNESANALRRGLLKFDVASAVPAGAHIDAVTLQLTMSRAISGATDIALHQVLADWGEGTTDAGGQEGKGAAATANSATWVHRSYPTTTWAAAGGSFTGGASAVTSVAGDGVYRWSSSQMVADVQKWLDSTPTAQFGWLVKAVNETIAGNAKRFDTRENPTNANRPLLTIDYTPVMAANKAPTIDVIGNPAAILEDASAQTVNLTGISAGPSESQTLTVTAVSSNVELIPNPNVTYTSPNTTASLNYTPVADQSGTATITVTVKDDGGTAAGGIDVTTRTFTVTVTPPVVNLAPTLDPLSDPAPILQDAGLQTIQLSGISAGSGETQNLSVTAISSNSGLIPTPTVSYTSPNGTGSITYTPTPGQFGTATITVTVKDDGGTAHGGIDQIVRTFRVTVSPAGANLPPTLDPIASPASILEDAGSQQIDLTGISAGGSESQTLNITALSSNTLLLPNPTVTYTYPNATGSLSYRPVADQSGTAVVTVTVQDSGGTAGGGVDVTTQTFTVTVLAVNDPPSFTKGTDLSVTDESPPQAVPGWASALAKGPADEDGQTLSFVLANNNSGLFAVQPAIDSNGQLTYVPRPNASGVADLSVVVMDNGGTAHGGTDVSSPQSLKITIAKLHPWHNTLNAHDVSGDNIVVPLDALTVINFLNSGSPNLIPPGVANGPPYYDTNNDGFVTSNDVLRIINELNGAGEGEEASGSRAPRGGNPLFLPAVANLPSMVSQDNEILVDEPVPEMEEHQRSRSAADVRRGTPGSFVLLHHHVRRSSPVVRQRVTLLT